MSEQDPGQVPTTRPTEGQGPVTAVLEPGPGVAEGSAVAGAVAHGEPAVDGAPEPEVAPAGGGDDGTAVEPDPQAPPVVHPDLTVEAAGFRGPLEGLVLAVQRGDVDPAQISVSGITGAFRRIVEQEADPPDPRAVADFLGMAARLVALKAARILPDGMPGLEEEDAEDAGDASADDPGRRLAEYRLFKAAAEALLSEAAEEGARSFLGMVAPEVIPVERLTIAPERLAAAFRAVLERIAQLEPVPVGTPTFSVEDKVVILRALLAARGTVGFEDIFEGVTSRLEAVACFLALLELLRRAEASVQQAEAFGTISVTAVA